MKKYRFDRIFLRLILIIYIIVVIPIFFRKQPIKDWLLVYFYNAFTNGIADNFLISKKFVKYPVRMFPNIFKVHFLFDFLVYPTITVLFNQMTMKDKPLAIILKLFFFTIPVIIIEIWAVKRTMLIKWQRGWKWYHSFLSMTVNTLSTRLFIAIIRKLGNSL